MVINKYLLAAVLSTAFILRFFSLGSIPPHPSLDEASIGYNAFSIMNTGRDEFVERFPLLLRAYDDYRPAHYTYLVIPFIKLIGLEVLAVRLPSVLLSLLTVLAAYYLVGELVSRHKYKTGISLAASALLAVSPWHIYISRLGHEVNLFYATFIFGLTFFFLFIKKKENYLLILSSVMLALSFSAYQSGKIFIPIIVITLVALYFRKLKQHLRLLLLSVLAFVAVILPILVVSTKPEALIRFHATNIYSLTEPYLAKSAENILKARASGDIIGELINNRRIVYVTLPAAAYISHINPIWLFANGGEEPFKTPNMGLLYPFESILIIIGLLLFLKEKKIGNPEKILIGVWFCASIVPGAITTGFPHAMRTFQILPIPQLLAAFGIISILSYLKFRKIYIITISLLYLFSIAFYMKSYFIDFPSKNAFQFQYGVVEAMKFVEMHGKKYDAIYVSNKNNLFQSYMFYLYANKVDPGMYQSSGGTGSGGYAQDHKFGKYYFGDIEKMTGKGLYVINPGERDGGNRIKTIYFPDGRESLWIIEE